MVAMRQKPKEPKAGRRPAKGAAPDAPIALTVRKVGNSLGVLLPQEATAAMHLGEGDKVYLTEIEGGYRITVYDPEFERQMAAARRVMREDRDVLRELAKR